MKGNQTTLRNISFGVTGVKNEETDSSTPAGTKRVVCTHSHGSLWARTIGALWTAHAPRLQTSRDFALVGCG
jgi:hypothetical protein